MMNNPIISIVVPVYNVEKYLHCCIDSILSQTYTDFELILIDDGSKDKSGIICDEYSKKDERIRVSHKANGGVSAARNSGIDKAKGKYIVFIDADDWIRTDYLAQFMEHVSDADLLIAYYKYVGCIPDAKQLDIEDITRMAAISIDEMFRIPFLMTAPWAKMYRTDIIKENGIRFNENLIWGEDMCFVSDYLCRSNGFSLIDNVGYMYRCFNGSAINKYMMTPKQFIYHISHIVQSIEKVSDKLGVKLQKIEEDEKCIYLNFYLETLKSFGYGELNTYVKEMQHLGILQFLPQSMSPKKVFLLKTAHFCPLIFFALIRILKLLRT